MRVVHDLLTAIALSAQYPIGFIGPFPELRCVRACCIHKIAVPGDITFLDSWEEYVAMFEAHADTSKSGIRTVHDFICICGKRMRDH